MCSLILILTAVSIRISRFYSIACDTYAENGIKGRITHEINQILKDRLLDFESTNLTEINYQSNGQIGSIQIDTSKVNQIAVELSNDIYECISHAENRFGVPFGNILGFDYLSGKGPEIGIKILPIGSVVYEIKSELISGGINQTLHRISIRFDIAINCIVPFHQSQTSISTEIIISETLIVGEVPNTLLSSIR